MGLTDDTPIAEGVGLKEAIMTNGASLVVIVVGLAIATFVNGTIGMIVAAVGVIGARGIAPRLSVEAAESTRGRAADSAETGEAQAMVTS